MRLIRQSKYRKELDIVSAIVRIYDIVKRYFTHLDAKMHDGNIVIILNETPQAAKQWKELKMRIEEELKDHVKIERFGDYYYIKPIDEDAYKNYVINKLKIDLVKDPEIERFEKELEKERLLQEAKEREIEREKELELIKERIRLKELEKERELEREELE